MSQVTLAIKTMLKIDEMIYMDQGASFRQFLEKLIPEARDAFEGQKDDFRSHLGCSLIGRECSRELWYNFRWVLAPKVDARMLRLFNRGHLEEPRMVAAMMTTGAQLWSHDENGDQFRVSYHGGHMGSAIDGVVMGCPDEPDVAILSEYKTHNDKSFTKLAGKNFKEFMEAVKNPHLPNQTFEGAGVKVAKFEHYVQMNIYMGYYNLPRAVYMAVNKNDDMIYAEIIEFDQAIYDLYVARGGKIIFANSPPPRISDNAGFWKCKYCDFRRVCHHGDPIAKNCRTCAASVPTQEGEWQCITFEKYINKETQMKGCGEYDCKLEFRE